MDEKPFDGFAMNDVQSRSRRETQNLDCLQSRRVQCQPADCRHHLQLDTGQHRQVQFEVSAPIHAETRTEEPDDAQFLQLAEWVECLFERFSALRVQTRFIQNEMLQVGQDRLAECAGERLESRWANEVPSDDSAAFEDELIRFLRVAETLHLEAVDLMVPPPRNGPQFQPVLQTQVAQHLLERQLRQIVHLRSQFGSVADRFSLADRFSVTVRFSIAVRFLITDRLSVAVQFSITDRLQFGYRLKIVELWRIDNVSRL